MNRVQSPSNISLLILFHLFVCFLSQREVLAKSVNLTGNVKLTIIKNNKEEFGFIPLDEKSYLEFDQLKIKMMRFELDVAKLSFSNPETTKIFKSESMFQVDRYPKAELVLVSEKKTKKITDTQFEYEVLVNLKIRNKSKSLIASAKLDKKSQFCLLDLELPIPDRTNFGLRFNSKKYTSEVELGEQIIADKIILNFNLKCKEKS